MEQQHLVQKYIFDVEYDSESNAYYFQNQLSDFIKSKILNLTDEVFTELGSKAEIGIQKLEINLGDLYIDSFEEEAVRKFKNLLSDKLQLLISGVINDPTVDKVEFYSPNQSNLKILQYFFDKGTLPWSTRKLDAVFSIKALILKCIEEDRAEVKKILELNIAKKEFRLRIVRQLDDEVIWKIISLWAEPEIVFYKKFLEDNNLIYSHKSIIKNTYVEYKELSWNYIISELVVYKRYKRSDVEIVASYLEFVSKEVQVPLTDLVKTYYEVILELSTKSSIDIDQDIESVLNNSNKNKNNLGSFATTFPIVIAKFYKERKLIKDNAFKRSEQQVNSIKEESLKLAETLQKDNEFESYRLEQVQLKQAYLVDFLKVVQYINKSEDIEEVIVRVENIIREFGVDQPVLLKRIFFEADLSIIEYKTFQIINLFSPEVIKIVVQVVYQTEIKSFEKERAVVARKILKQLILNGFSNTLKIPFIQTKPVIEKLWKNAISTETESQEVKQFVVETVLPSANKHFLIQQLQKYIPVKLLKKVFIEIPEVHQKQKADDVYSEDVFIQTILSSTTKTKKDIIIKLDDIQRIEDFVYVIQFLIKVKSFPSKVKFTVSELIEKFYKSHKQIMTDFIVSIKETDFRVIEKQITPSCKVVLEKVRDEVHQSITKVIKAEPILEAFQKPKENKVSEEKSFETPFKKFDSGEPIYINNAGLVIFNPYLSRFFKMLNLMDKNKFLDEYSSHKAVHILQYLVNKTTNSEEHELTINKIMCGIPLTTPLIKDIEITEEEKTTCESLIEGVIQNWTILKKTSNDGFRDSFIKREGRLLYDPKGWNLKVEDRGYDILVEKIPWTISMVKLPWMEKIIYVEWR
jgi:hypothetical protein